MRRVSILTILAVLMAATSSFAAERERVVFDFSEETAARPWQPVNDGVMGGRSVGQFRMTDADTMEFFGNLSLENNGGFASVRARGIKMGLQKGDSLVIRVRGDGREYSLNLYTARRLTAFSYRTFFKTKKSEWIEVEIPVEKFVATSFGRVLRNQRLDPGAANGLGFLLGDKKPGPFKLEIDWIKVRSKSTPSESADAGE